VRVKFPLCRSNVIVNRSIPENRCDLVTSGRFRPGKSGNPGGRPKEIGHKKEMVGKIGRPSGDRGTRQYTEITASYGARAYSDD
jgi:hypothetical protein